jgi:hypothetical protein
MCVCRGVCVWMYVCMYVCVLCMYVLCMYVYVCVMYVCVCMYVLCMYVCMCYVCMCVYVCMYVCIYSVSQFLYRHNTSQHGLFKQSNNSYKQTSRLTPNVVTRTKVHAGQSFFFLISAKANITRQQLMTGSPPVSTFVTNDLSPLH